MRKLREGDRLLNEGKGMAEVLRSLEIMKPWRSQCGGLTADDAKCHRQLETENDRTKKPSVEAELDKTI